MTHEMKMSELLPCPFCGGNNLSIENLTEDDDYSIECSTCRLGQHAIHTYKGAIKAWNTRPPQDAAVEPDYEAIAEVVLKAAGSGFKHYMPASKERIISDLRNHMSLDVGPELPHHAINAWRNPLIIAAWREGLSTRAVGRIFDVSHDTVATIVKALPRTRTGVEQTEGGPEALDKEYETYQGKDGTTYVEIDIEDFGDICRFARAALRSQEITGGVDAKRVAEVIEENEGFWHTCSGCHETEDGHDVGEYPYSETFKCKLGSGCRECGGLGAVWDNTDYEDMAKSMQATGDKS